MVEQNIKPGFFDVPYGIASVNLTTGATVVASTGGSYFGMILEAATTIASIIVYDNASTVTGNKLDVLTITTGAITRPDRYFILQAKNGITVSLTGEDAKATIFYGPKG